MRQSRLATTSVVITALARRLKQNLHLPLQRSKIIGQTRIADLKQKLAANFGS